MKNIVSFIKYGILAIILGTLALTSCKKVDHSIDLTGEWKLENTSSNIGGEMDINVYISFDGAAKSFEIYQKLGQGHFRKFTGSYSFTENIMSGNYSDGKPLASQYEVSLEGDVLTMKSFGGENIETNVYHKCTIPAEVKKDAADYAPSTKSADSYRIL